MKEYLLALGALSLAAGFGFGTHTGINENFCAGVKEGIITTLAMGAIFNISEGMRVLYRWVDKLAP